MNLKNLLKFKNYKDFTDELEKLKKTYEFTLKNLQKGIYDFKKIKTFLVLNNNDVLVLFDERKFLTPLLYKKEEDTLKLSKIGESISHKLEYIIMSKDISYAKFRDHKNLKYALDPKSLELVPCKEEGCKSKIFRYKIVTLDFVENKEKELEKMIIQEIQKLNKSKRSQIQSILIKSNNIRKKSYEGKFYMVTYPLQKEKLTFLVYEDKTRETFIAKELSCKNFFDVKPAIIEYHNKEPFTYYVPLFYCRDNNGKLLIYKPKLYIQN